MTDTSIIGHNQPPTVDLAGLEERLLSTNAPIRSRRDDLLAAEARIPEITDDDVAGRVADFIKQVAAARKDAEARRVAEKEPFMSGQRIVDGFFKKVLDPLDQLKSRVQTKLDGFLRAKADRLRREAEEQERRRREEEDRQRREAEAAEKARREAEERAQREAEAAELLRRQAKNEQERREAERLRAEAAERSRIETEALQRQQDIAAEAAAKAAADKDAAAKQAALPTTKLSHTRGDHGALAGLRRRWTFRVVNEYEVPREFLMVNETAVRQAVAQGARAIPGVEIFEETKAVVR